MAEAPVPGPARSPYEVVLGDAIDALPGPLRAYFGAIPPGHVGRGSGVFTAVGTPRWWLWPLLAILGRGGAMFGVGERDVPFEVENRPVVADGRPAVAAQRTFRLRSGPREMVDLIGATSDARLYDLLGRERTILVLLEPAIEGATVEDAALEDRRLVLRSRDVRIRVGALRIRIPRALSPRALLVERHGDFAHGTQHVSLTIDLPLVGRVYEYAGSFSYAIERPDR